jgi:putative addiction module killer protein
VYELRHYVTPAGRDLVQEWLDRLRNPRAYAAVLRRIDRMALGNFGDHEFCREGVWELRIDVGPGYRVYYALHGSSIVFILCGGDKRKQSTDIARAIDYFRQIKKEAQ